MISVIAENLYSTILHPFEEKTDGQKLEYFEVLGLSWIFHFIYAFYSIFAIYLGLKALQYHSDATSLADIVTGSFNITFQKIMIFSGLSEAIFYPFVFHLSYRFWMFLLKFFAEVFEYDENAAGSIEENSTSILNALYASNVFLMIPVVGKLMSILAQGFYLYRGVIKKLNFTNTQAILVLMTPLFIIFLFAILIVSYFAFIISLI
jgi:hypothetical protein